MKQDNRAIPPHKYDSASAGQPSCITELNKFSYSITYLQRLFQRYTVRYRLPGLNFARHTSTSVSGYTFKFTPLYRLKPPCALWSNRLTLSMQIRCYIKCLKVKLSASGGLVQWSLTRDSVPRPCWGLPYPDSRYRLLSCLLMVYLLLILPSLIPCDSLGRHVAKHDRVSFAKWSSVFAGLHLYSSENFLISNFIKQSGHFQSSPYPHFKDL